MGVGLYDILDEHSVNYHAALKAAGVHVVYREFPTLNHGFFSYTSISPTCTAAADLICDDLRGLFAPAGYELAQPARRPAAAIGQ